MGPTHCILIKDASGEIIRRMLIAVIDLRNIDGVIEEIAELAVEFQMPDGYSIEIIPFHIQN